VTFDVHIEKDGTFYASQIRAAYGKIWAIEITGNIVGDDLELDIGNVYCAAHYSLKKQRQP
jgi:hypothetical protein